MKNSKAKIGWLILVSQVPLPAYPLKKVIGGQRKICLTEGLMVL